MPMHARGDPIVFEWVKNPLASVADEMAVTLVRTARAFVIKEAMDFSTAICNADGEMVAQGRCLPLQMGSIPSAMGAVIACYGGHFQPGDIFPERNVRVPTTVLGDIMAEVAGCRSGERKLSCAALAITYANAPAELIEEVSACNHPH
jgi:N-methylhydantoinase B